MALLEVTDLRSGYTDVAILDGVSIEVERGEIVTLLGPNGSGKSTMLKSILKTHEVRIFSGSVIFDGEDVTDDSNAELIDRGISYVPQARSTFPELSIRDNLQLGGYTLDDRSDLGEKIDAIYEMFPELGERERAQAQSLSGGQQRMLEFGRALITDPELIFLDEPSIGLAPKISKRVFSKVEAICDERDIGMLIVEQNPMRSLDISDRAYILDQGQIVVSDTPENILSETDLADMYLGGLQG